MRLFPPFFFLPYEKVKRLLSKTHSELLYIVFVSYKLMISSNYSDPIFEDLYSPFA